MSFLKDTDDRAHDKLHNPYQKACHCEERSDVAISLVELDLGDCRAPGACPGLSRTPIRDPGVARNDSLLLCKVSCALNDP